MQSRKLEWCGTQSLEARLGMNMVVKILSISKYIRFRETAIFELV